MTDDWRTRVDVWLKDAQPVLALKCGHGAALAKVYRFEDELVIAHADWAAQQPGTELRAAGATDRQWSRRTRVVGRLPEPGAFTVAANRCCALDVTREFVESELAAGHRHAKVPARRNGLPV